MSVQQSAVAPVRSRPEPPVGAQAVAVVIGLAAVLAVVFLALAWPSVKSGAHQVPVAAAGPAPALAELQQALERSAPGAYEVRTVADEAALRRAVRDRQVYGGFVLGPGGARVLIATAASPAVAQALTAAASALGARSGRPVPVEELRALPPDDPRGAGLAAAALPIALGGTLPALLLRRRFPDRPGLRLLSSMAFALVAGLTVAAILRYVFGSVDSDVWAVWLGLSLGLAAISLTVLGLATLFGTAGLGFGLAVMVLLGSPLSGLASAPELLPAGWGAVGQLLPPGANGTLLRSTAFFDGAGALRPIVVLSCWVALGLALHGLAAARAARAERLSPAAARAGGPRPAAGPAP